MVKIKKKLKFSIIHLSFLVVFSLNAQSTSSSIHDLTLHETIGSGSSLDRTSEDFEYDLIRLGRNDLFKKLVEQNEILIEKDYKHGKLLHNACFLDNNDLVSFLLEKGANTDGALQWCAEFNNKEAMFLVIAKGANINYQDFLGWTVLHKQASALAGLYQRKNRELEYGKKTKSIDEKIDDRKRTIVYLVRKGAKLTIKNRLDRIPVQVATNITGSFKYEIQGFFNELEKI